MFPTLFTVRFGGRELAFHTYGVLIAIGLAAGIALAYREGRRRGFDGGRVLDAAFWMIVAGLVGSRIVYGIVNAREFARVCFHGGGEPRSAGAVLSDCARILAIWQGGLVFYGGVAGAALVGWRFAKREGWSFAAFGDLFAPALALGHAFGRLGCFAAGCCFGKVGGGHWAAVFPRGSVAFDEMAAMGAIPAGWDMTPGLHPTQLYEAFGEFAIFAAPAAAPPARPPPPGDAAGGVPRPLRAAALRRRDVPGRRHPRPRRRARDAAPRGMAAPARRASRSSSRSASSAASRCSRCAPSLGSGSGAPADGVPTRRPGLPRRLSAPFCRDGVEGQERTRPAQRDARYN